MENASLPRKKVSRKVICLFGLILAGAIASGGYAVLREHDYLLAVSELQGAISAYKRERLPWQAADFCIQMVPDKENAADEIKSALSRIPTAIYEESTSRYSGATGTDSSAVSTRSALKQLNLHKAAFDQMIKATQKPKLDFGRDWSQGTNVDMSNLKQLSWFVANLSLRFRLLTYLGRLDEALEHISAAWRLASLIRQEPSASSFQDSLRWETIILTNISSQLPHFAGTEADLDKVKKILGARPAYDIGPAVRGYIFSEVVTARKLNTRRLSYNLPDSSKGLISSYTDQLSSNSLKKDAYYCRVLQATTEMGKVLNRTELSDEDKISAIEKIRLSYRTKKGLSHEIIQPFDGVGSELLDLSVQARRTCLLATIEAIRIKLRTNKVPNSISAIPGEWPDPYRNAPISFARRDGRFVFYSVGPDRIDNGGKYQWTPKSQAIDIGVVCPF